MEYIIYYNMYIYDIIYNNYHIHLVKFYSFYKCFNFLELIIIVYTFLRTKKNNNNWIMLHKMNIIIISILCVLLHYYIHFMKCKCL